jgi:RNA polymerase sigma-70 factor (ECF subfamily)
MKKLSPLEEKALVKRIIKGEQAAIGEFWQVYCQPLRGFVSYRVDSPEDVDDIVQETLTAAILSLPSFRFRSRLFSWLCAIANHEIADFYRKRRLKTILFSRFPFLETIAHHSLGPEGESLKEELKEEIKKTLKEMSEGYRQILRLKYIEGLSLKQIAKQLGTTPKAIESRLARARKAFQKLWRW